MARELRNRYLEEYNRAGGELAGEAKYDVSRQRLAGEAKGTLLITDARAA